MQSHIIVLRTVVLTQLLSVLGVANYMGYPPYWWVLNFAWISSVVPYHAQVCSGVLDHSSYSHIKLTRHAKPARVMLGHRVALAKCTREIARGTGSFSGQATCVWVALAGTGDPLVLTEGAEVEDAVDVFELLSFGRDRKNYVNINTGVCTVYCDS